MVRYFYPASYVSYHVTFGQLRMNRGQLLLPILGRRLALGKHRSRCIMSNRLRLICTENDDFKWMDVAEANLKVHDASGGYVKLTAEQWSEFERNGFVENIEDAEIVDDERDEEMSEISEELLLEFMQLEGEDIRKIIDDDYMSSEDSEAKDASFELTNEISKSDKSHPDTAVTKFSEQTQVKGDEIHPWEYTDEEEENYKTPSGITNFRKVMPEGFASLPVQAKKSGMETRVRRQQNEMWNTVHHVLSTQYSEWDKSGANIMQVVLSPDLRDLSVIYDAPPEVARRKSWDRLLKQATKSIRVELSKRHAKYTPKVHFQSSPHAENHQLDDIFNRIALERQQN